MKTLLVAVGNPLRGDDGVAERVLSMVPIFDNVERKAIFGLTPELAQEVAGHELVVIIDADVSVKEATLQPIEPSATPSPALVIAHSLSPQALIDLAHSLFSFTGQALLCSIPVADFSTPYQLTETAANGANEASRLMAEALAAHNAPQGRKSQAERNHRD